MNKPSPAAKQLLGNHQRCWVWGRNVIAETLRAGRWRPHELRLADEPFEGRDELQAAAETVGVAVLFEPAGRLAKLCGATDHQGVIAKMPPFPYHTVQEILSAPAWEPLLVLCDHLTDPYNLGAIIRSAEAFGADGLIFPSRDAVGVTSQVARSSAGAVNHVRIARVDDLPQFAETLKQRGIRLLAASEHAAASVDRAVLTGPMALVIGNEGSGIRPTLLSLCDDAVSIPLSPGVGSLNAAVAAGVLLYEAARQRGFPAAR